VPAARLEQTRMAERFRAISTVVSLGRWDAGAEKMSKGVEKWVDVG
jgi:hypothetical protein